MVKLRPLSVGEILDAGINVLRQAGGPVLVVSAVAFIPALIAAISAGTVNVFALFADREWAALSFIGVTMFVGSIIAKSFAIITVSELVYEANRDWKWRLEHLGRSLPGIVNNRIIFWIAFPILSLLLIAPGWWFATNMAVSQASVLMEDKVSYKAFRRSNRLVKARFGQVVGWSFALAILALAVALGTNGLIELTQFSPSTDTALSMLSAYLSVVLMFSMLGTSSAILLIDLRVREEGHDLELIRRKLEIPVPKTVATVTTEVRRPSTAAAEPIWEPPQ